MNLLNSILILVAAYLAVFCEAVFGGLRHWVGAQLDLLPALMVYASLSSNLLTVALLAGAGGMLYDSLSANPLGVSVLPLLLIGFVIHQRRELILRDQAFAQFSLGLGACAFAPLATLLLVLTTGQQPLVGWGSLWQWGVTSLAGAIATPLIFQVFARFNQLFGYRRAAEAPFRPDRQIRRGRS